MNDHRPVATAKAPAACRGRRVPPALRRREACVQSTLHRLAQLGPTGRASIRIRSSTVRLKRIHEYKRQLLNVLHILVLYNGCARTPTPR